MGINVDMPLDLVMIFIVIISIVVLLSGMADQKGGWMNSPIDFPDPTLCRTKHVFGSYYSCLNKNTKLCPYSFGFEKDFFCYHPNCSIFEEAQRR